MNDYLATGNTDGIIRCMTGDVNKSIQGRVVALSLQAHIAWMINALARKGECNEALFVWMCEILWQENCTVETLQHAVCLRTLKQQLQGDFGEDSKTIMHYMMGVLALEKTLSHNQAMLTTIAERLQHIGKQRHLSDKPDYDTLSAGVADVYGDTLSTLKPRIVIHGKPEYLNHSSNTNKLRTLLLVGIRAAYVWRSHGGNHFRLIFERKKMLNTLAQLQHHSMQGGRP